jgi:hypothetical protein
MYKPSGVVCLVGLTGITITACFVAGISVAINQRIIFGVAAFAMALATTVLYARPRLPWVALATDALLKTFIMMMASAVLQYAAAVPAFPYIDRWIAAADTMIGFDWLALHAWTWSHPLAAHAQTYAYGLLLPQLFPALFLLARFDARALQRFLVANVTVMMITIAISLVIPAAGAMAWFHPAATPITPESYPVQLDLVRSGALRAVDARAMVGLIQFPSYHAALAVLLGLAFSSTPRWIAMPVWVLEGSITISAPIMGGHYGTDILAGILLALVVHFSLRKIMRFSA